MPALASLPQRPWAAAAAAGLLVVLGALAPPSWRPVLALGLAGAGFALHQTGRDPRFSLRFGAGLLACGAGDLLLGPAFRTGLLALALGQWLFALALAPEAIGRSAWPWRALAALPAAWILAVEVPQLPPSLALIALLYCSASAAMAGCALARARLHPGTATAGVAAGALLFVASDVLAMFNHFIDPLPRVLAEAGIPALYYAAQLLLACHAAPLGEDAPAAPVQPLRPQSRTPAA